MNVIDIMNPPEAIWIGRKGENVFREVPIDCSGYIEKHPNATITAMYQSGENEPFPVVLEQNGNTFTWKPRSEEITDEYGRIEIVLTDGEAVGASKIVECFVDESLIDGTEHPAESAPAWSVEMVQDVTEQADRAKSEADRAEQAAADVEITVEETVASAVPPAIADYLETHPIEETDPTVQAWAKQPTKPTYTAQEVGALPSSYTPPVTSVNGMTGDVVVETGGGGAVDSVNGKTGAVMLGASDVGALPDDTQIPSKTSDLTNDSGFVTAQQAAASAPVQSVNGMTGAVTIPTGSSDAVLYTPQSLTDSQKAQARTNVGAGTYSKPSGGIPASDLASAVQTSLGKADTALQTAPVTSVNGMTGSVTVKTPYYLTVTTENGTTYVDKTPAEIDALSVAGYDVHMRLPMTLAEYTAIGDMRYFAMLGISAFYGIARFGNAPLIATARVTEQKIVHYELTSVATEADIARIEAALTNKADMSDIPSLSGYATETWVEGKGYQTVPFVIPINLDEQGNWSTTASAEEIFDNADNCIINLMGSHIIPMHISKYEQLINISFTYGTIQYGMLMSQTIFIEADKSNNNVNINIEYKHANLLPDVTDSDNGKFLRVVSGAWAAATIPAAESASFGGA